MKACPVCGRSLLLRPSGLLPRHNIKLPPWRNPLQKRQQCPGSGSEPRDISPAGPAPALHPFLRAKELAQIARRQLLAEVAATVALTSPRRK